MIVCCCRNISEKDVHAFAKDCPHLTACWIAASTKISGEAPQCGADGKGCCHDYGQGLLDLLRDETPSP